MYPNLSLQDSLHLHWINKHFTGVLFTALCLSISFHLWKGGFNLLLYFLQAVNIDCCRG